MKAITATLAMCGFTCLNLIAGEIRKPYVIQRGDETLVVSNMPAFTVSDPITNSFVYFSGEYISPPYSVSVSNLAVCLNGRVIRNYELGIKKTPVMSAGGLAARTNGYMTVPAEHGGGTFPVTFSRRAGITTENVGESIDSSCRSWVKVLERGGVLKFFKEEGGYSRSGGGDDDGGGLAFVELARKAERGDEKARAELINAFKLGGSIPDFRPGWIQRLAGNTDLEARATRILEAKRQREQHERERRERQDGQDRQDRQDRHGNPRQDGNAHQ
jgi:hypothetical protein